MGEPGHLPPFCDGVGQYLDVDIPPNATASFVARRAGTFDYTCKYHPGMKGRPIVAK